MPTEINFPAKPEALPGAVHLNELLADQQQASPVGVAPTAPVPLGTAMPVNPMTKIADSVQAGQQKELEDFVVADEATMWDAAKAAAMNWDTTFMVEAVADERELMFNQIDPNYDAKADYNAALARHGLADTERTLEVFASSGSQAETDYLAEKLKEHDRNELLLENHGVVAFVGAAVDPVRLVQDWATFNVGKAMRLGRMGHGVMQAGADVGVSYVADQLGAEYTAMDYALSAAIGGGIGVLTGGRVDMSSAKSMAAAAKPGGVFDRTWLTDELSEFDKLTPTPESQGLLGAVLDDPVRRGGTNNKNAVSYNRIYQNMADVDLKGIEDGLNAVLSTRYGIGTFRAMMDFSGKATKARLQIEHQVSQELARRNAEFLKYGSVGPARVDPEIAKLADQFEQASTKAAIRAKEAGLSGFEDFEAQPGYFHRAWNPGKMRNITETHGKDFMRDLLSLSLVTGGGLEKDLADTISTAIITRAQARDANLRTEFLGSLGKTDTESIREMLVSGGVDEATIKSVMGRIESHQKEAGKVKFGKSRLPMDMTVSLRAPDGTVVSALDLIDTDLTRLTENYLQTMSGRSALAKALTPLGYGGDDAALQRYKADLLKAYRGQKPTPADEANLRDMIAGDTPAPKAPETPPAAAPAVPATTPQAPATPTPVAAVPGQLSPKDFTVSGFEHRGSVPRDIAELHQKLSDVDSAEDAVKILVGEVTDPGLKVIAERLMAGMRGLPEIKFRVLDWKDEPDIDSPTIAGITKLFGDGSTEVIVRGAGTGRSGINYSTILHEVMHAVTMNFTYGVKRDDSWVRPKHRSLVRQLEELHTHTKAVAAKGLKSQALLRLADEASKGMDTAQRGAFVQSIKRGLDKITKTSNYPDDVQEFLAWGFTDPDVQNALKVMPGIGKAKSSIWNQFMASITKALGLRGNTALAELMDLGNRTLEEAAPMVRGQKPTLSLGPRTQASDLAAPEGRTPLTDDSIEARMDQFEHLIGDFTGQRPESAKLGIWASRARSLAQATMLAASGLWQVVEFSTMACMYGKRNTALEFMKFTPGLKGLLKEVGSDKELFDELSTVVGLDFTKDVRVRPWLAQWEANMTAEGGENLNRILHLGQQAVPILNGMKYVHSMQTRMAANMSMNTLVKAANGDKNALKLIESYGLKGAEWERVQQEVLDRVEMRGKNAKAMNWDAWDKDASDSALAVITRMQDSAVLFGRPGEGSSYQRTAVGQILGQFRSFVGYAHNKQLRATIQNEGYTGLAVLLAYQFPLTFMMVTTNEFVKGREVDFSEEGLTKLFAKSIGYTAALGYIGDAASIVGLTGGRGGLTTPVTGLANAPLAFANGTKNILTGEFQEGLSDYMQVARTALPFVNIIPGVAALNEALKE